MAELANDFIETFGPVLSVLAFLVIVAVACKILDWMD